MGGWHPQLHGYRKRPYSGGGKRRRPRHTPDPAYRTRYVSIDELVAPDDIPDLSPMKGDMATPNRNPDAPESGAALIKDFVSRLPDRPGVYRMLDDRQQVLYVGKAKSLKKRVASYTRTANQPVRLRRMIHATRDMEFVVTETETEALLLEATLIKRLKPRYNILLRDDKSFPYILIRKDHPAPQLVKHRGARNIKGDYYGPFASAGAVNRTVDTLQRAFGLRTCSDSVYEQRTRPCMLYQIKRCSGPCTGEIALDDYRADMKDASAFLSGKSEALRGKLQTQMQAASAAMQFERAAAIRDRLRALAHVTTANSGINPTTFTDGDVVGLHSAGGQTCVQVFFFRAGQNWGNSSHFPRHLKGESEGEILEAFLAQFYADKPIPKDIYVSHAIPEASLLEEALSSRSGRLVSISRPQRGEKRKIVARAVKNAEEALSRKLAESASQARLLEAVRERFGMEEIPQRIEIYDNSHIQGANAIGAFVVATPEGFDRRAYRTFNIRDEGAAGDDFAMMREVFRRRFERLAKTKAATWPDLVLVDGGKGQLSSVTEVLSELGVLDKITLVAIAKGVDRDAGRETFYMNGREPFMLPPRAPELYYLQRLRDEAHRFAIGTHRARRKKQIKQNPLDAIPGVGPGRKKALLSHFGSAKGVKGANVEDLASVDGISATMARTIYDYFRG